MSETPWRSTLEEALADAQSDFLLYGAVYVIRGVGNTYRRMDPTRIRYESTCKCYTFHEDFNAACPLNAD